MKFTHISLAATLLLCSCGTKTSTPTSKNVCGTEVYGDGNGVISIVPDKYTLTKKDGRIKLKLEKSVDKKVESYPEIILKDEDGVEIISGWKQMEMSSSEKSKFDSFIRSEEGTIKEFVFINEFSADYFTDALTKSETFSLDKLKFEESKEDKGLFDEDLEKAIKQTKDIMDTAGDLMDMNKSLMDVAKMLSE